MESTRAEPRSVRAIRLRARETEREDAAGSNCSSFYAGRKNTHCGLSEVLLYAQLSLLRWCLKPFHSPELGHHVLVSIPAYNDSLAVLLLPCSAASSSVLAGLICCSSQGKAACIELCFGFAGSRIYHASAWTCIAVALVCCTMVCVCVTTIQTHSHNVELLVSPTAHGHCSWCGHCCGLQGQRAVGAPSLDVLKAVERAVGGLN